MNSVLHGCTLGNN